ncbi:MAG: glycogen/starch/alpha-glucan phosphorylase [Clostridiales bacterium]|nr:glycogen/starch/alpha-glucan phosphorylase [Clostridiales bacterium]
MHRRHQRMGTRKLDKELIKGQIKGKLQRYNGRTVNEATPQQIYKAVASVVRDQIMEKWAVQKQNLEAKKEKQLYYLSVEFLMGRSLHCNILNLCSTKEYREAMEELGIDYREIIREEPEPGLGNGGLGRLAACFLDSLSSLDLPATGGTIRYEYGLFRQRIVEGQQVEVADDWLVSGNMWEIPAGEEMCEVRYGGRVDVERHGDKDAYILRDYTVVEAVPYIMPVVGFDTETVNSLYLWKAKHPEPLDFRRFSQGGYATADEEADMAEAISKVLYPEDNHYEGKKLRLRQHYFFTSATLQMAIRKFKKSHGNNFALLPEKAVFHINDTHPGLCIPELLRILIDEEGLGWDEAYDIVRKSVAYTNHTIMAEALEKWPAAMMKEMLPRIYMIIEELNRRLSSYLWDKFPDQWEKISSMSILANGQVHMANLCVAVSYSVNGVSQLHGEILKADTFHDYYTIMPSKFSAITNGITHRRWLIDCNPLLTDLINQAIGEKWITDTKHLNDLLPFRDDPAFREKFAAVKRQNKERLAKMIWENQKIKVDPDFMFDVQAKRLHEYKRQLLNAIHILVLYNRIVDNPNYTIEPRTFFFGAKASPGYVRAKQIIRFIISLSKLIDNHPRARTMLQIVFLENYDVSKAEILIPGAEVSEQISTASKEASGTGNMKFMMNGALTIGTLDGANVEMTEQVGMDNIYIFGMRAETVVGLYKDQSYQAMQIFETNEELRRALTQMIDGTVSPENPALYQDLYHSLLMGEGGMADPYFVLKDFGSYSMAQLRLNEDYQDKEKWWRMAVSNTASSGMFSSDRTIAEYNDTIWHLTPLEHRNV